MKKFLALLCAMMVAVMSLSGCGSQDSSTAEDGDTSENNDAMKCMVIARNLTDPFCAWLMDMCEKDLQENYPDVEYTIVDQQGDPAMTDTLFNQAIIQGYDAIVLHKTGSMQNVAPQLQAARDAGISVSILNFKPDDEYTSASYVPDYTMGTIAAEYAVEHLPKNAKVVFYLGPPAVQTATDRVQAYRDILFEQRPDIELLDEKNVENWSKDTAMRIMEDWCQRFPEIDAVISVNDGMALGGIEALKAAGRDVANMEIYGIDGLADGCLSIEAGELKMTVLQDAQVMGYNGVDLAMKMAMGEMKEATIMEVTPELINADNVDEFLEMHRENGIIS